MTTQTWEEVEKAVTKFDIVEKEKLLLALGLKRQLQFIKAEREGYQQVNFFDLVKKIDVEARPSNKFLTDQGQSDEIVYEYTTHPDRNTWKTCRMWLGPIERFNRVMPLVALAALTEAKEAKIFDDFHIMSPYEMTAIYQPGPCDPFLLGVIESDTDAMRHAYFIIYGWDLQK